MNCPGRSYLILFAGEVAELETPLNARITVFGNSSGEKVQPVIDELFRVLSRCAEVNELDLGHD